MTDTRPRYVHFRLDFDQQRKRAKELLKAAKAGDASAVARLREHALGAADASAAPRLADAQRAIARELRFRDWAELKRHVTAMERERAAATPLDADLRTLHVRCGSDVRDALAAAGFVGDFYEHSYPYLAGPVREGEGAIEERARFIVDSYADEQHPFRYDTVLGSLREAERLLAESHRYARVVIWSEGDCYDQLVLVRLLAHYAEHDRPARLELVTRAEFPGATRFLGLGQLPPEALRLLWAERREATPEQLALGLRAWRALASDDPRALAALARSGAPEWPPLAPALRRHLSELPAVGTGLACTERMALELLAERPHTLQELFARMTYGGLDPLPGQGDLQVRDRVLGMEGGRERVFVRRESAPSPEARPPWTDTLEITPLGRAVLAGDVDYRSLEPPTRWVGGVRLEPSRPAWRWNAVRQDVARDADERSGAQ